MSTERADEEHVIVLSAEQVRALDLTPGFDRRPERLIAALAASGVTRALPRSVAESDPRFRQLVAYVVLRHGDRVFHYRRSARAGEPRLAGRRSLGVGGHLNADDLASGDAATGLARAIQRELDEEVVLPHPPAVRYLGVVHDDTSAVSAVHLGLVAVVELTAPSVQPRDPTLIEPRFDRLDDLVAQSPDFETWSQWCLAAL
jgi:predicted NUDIX family phosphoesterase